MSDLYSRSIEIILKNQDPGGAYVACPNFPTYQYSWYRDSAYIAYAMDVAGVHDSASRFHAWAAENILRRQDVIMRAVDKSRKGTQLAPQDFLHTRYKLNGHAADEDWPNFQLDGFGTWLWSLGEHLRLNPAARPPAGAEDAIFRAADLAAEYLSTLWNQPCYDCWEEFPDKIHSYTLAAIYGGLNTHQQIAGRDHSRLLQAIRSYLFEKAIGEDHFVKYCGTLLVDASLLGLSTPYAVISESDPLMVKTVAAIEKTLFRNGGVHRYAEDSYYGGGQWILLSAWLGWYYARSGERQKMKQVLAWIEAQADEAGQLAEQIPNELIAPDYYPVWRKRWGDIASPLLWSHAKYIILASEK